MIWLTYGNIRDKIKFIESIYKIAFSDDNLHYLEDHIIKQIAKDSLKIE